MPAQLLFFHPRHRPGRNWVYLFAFKNGVVKVGRSSWVRSRLASHGLGKMAWCHIGPCGDAYFASRTEATAIRLLSDIGSRIRRTETFAGLTKAQAMAALHEAERLVRSDHLALAIKANSEASAA